MSKVTIYRQPWLGAPTFDILYILLPGFLALAVTAVLPGIYKTTDAMPLAGWVLLVLLVDVAHVYSTLFRTYMDPLRIARHRNLYIAIPVLCYIAGVLLYSTGSMVFWRCLAYLAVYHFVRQQYGFLRLYTRGQQRNTLPDRLDAIAIYTATIYPLIWWHTAPGRNFSWFMPGDFMLMHAPILRLVAGWLYILIIAGYVAKEIVLVVKDGHINLPKNLLMAGTFLTWYFGIVYYNGDMAFTLLNVVAHGIPYMALVWLFRKKEAMQSPATTKRSAAIPVLYFIAVVVLLAYLEEGFWDGFVWRERTAVFGLFHHLPTITSNSALAFLVPLLSLPQSTHYVLDGFIWRKGA